jgi:SlyX protein
MLDKQSPAKPQEETMDRTTDLEERVAHLMRAVEDLSDVVAKQANQLDRVLALTQLLAQREAYRETDAMDAPPADQKPPHW